MRRNLAFALLYGSTPLPSETNLDKGASCGELSDKSINNQTYFVRLAQ